MNQSFFDHPTVRILVIGVLAALGLWLAAKFITEVMGFSYVGRNLPPSNVITVQGEGEIFAKADIASVSFTVSEEKKTVEEAQQIATEKIDAALAAVRALGIEEKDIKTTNYSVYPQYEWKQGIPCTQQWGCPPGDQELKGYTVSQSITLKIRDTKKVGKVLEVLGGAGINSISGPDFTIDDDLTLKAEARAKAIADAKERAEQLADDLDVRLVRIVSFYENTGGPVYALYGKGGDMAGTESIPSRAPEVPTGENRIFSQVSITYEIR